MFGEVMSLSSNKTIQVAPAGRFLFPAEVLILTIIFFVGVAAVLVVFVMGRAIQWPPFLVGFFAALALFGVAGYIRAVKHSPRLALGLVGFAMYMSFIVVSGLFIFSLLPLPHPLYDERLIAVDAALGYNWAGFVNWLADFQLIALILAYLYGNSLLQLLMVIVVLAWYSKPTALHRFLLTGILTMMATVVVWWLWPTIGPSGFQEIPDTVIEATNLVFHPGHGAQLKELVENGPAMITPDVIIGIIAFPSYHMIMACMVAWYSYRTLLFYPAILAGAGMIPATLSHGGHHFVDLLAGVIVFAIGSWVSSRLIRPSGPESS
jgi:hypothetical protein